MGLRATAVMAFGCQASSAWAEGAAHPILVDARAPLRLFTIWAAQQVHRSGQFP